MRGAKAEYAGLFILGERLIAGTALVSYHRRQDDDPFLALLNIAPHPEPGLKTGHARGVRALTVDQQNVTPRILPEPGHHPEVGLEGITLATFERGEKLRDRVFAESLG